MNKYFWVFAVCALAVLMYRFTMSKDIDPEELSGKRVLITGASKNIGKELAYEFSRYGAKVVITARRENQLKEVVKQCKKLGATEAYYIVADMADLSQTKSVIEQAVKNLGGLDYLVLNHVYGDDNPHMWNTSKLDYLDRSITVNYLSYVHLSSYATSYLTASNGHLLVVSSLAGHVPVVNTAPYGATKAALNHFYATLRLEMSIKDQRDYSITICLLGSIATANNRWQKYPNQVKIKAYPIEKTAQEIVAAGATRSSYVFIPTWTFVSGILRAFPSDFMDWLYLKLIFKK